MKDEIKEILDYFKRSNKNKLGFEQDKIITYKEANQLLDYITNLQEEVEDLRRIFGVWNNRKLIKKFNKEYDKEDKTKNPNRDYVAIYPDAEEVYKRYYALKEENDRLNNIIKNLDEMFEYYFLGNSKYDQDTVNTIYIKYAKLKDWIKRSVNMNKKADELFRKEEKNEI